MNTPLLGWCITVHGLRWPARAGLLYQLVYTQQVLDLPSLCDAAPRSLLVAQHGKDTGPFQHQVRHHALVLYPILAHEPHLVADLSALVLCRLLIGHVHMIKKTSYVQTPLHDEKDPTTHVFVFGLRRSRLVLKRGHTCIHAKSKGANSTP